MPEWEVGVAVGGPAGDVDDARSAPARRRSGSPAAAVTRRWPPSCRSSSARDERGTSVRARTWNDSATVSGGTWTREAWPARAIAAAAAAERVVIRTTCSGRHASNRREASRS